jgi:hypothetical protein
VTPHFRLSNRTFQVASAVIDLSAHPPTLDIETVGVDVDGERWAPYLYHHGLVLGTLAPDELQGSSHVLAAPEGGCPPQQDSGYLYVFGHEEWTHAALHFGRLSGDQIELYIQGAADVLWDDTFGAAVPFECVCLATVIPA